MIERMRKLNLIALSYERDRLLDVLERTGAAEVKLHAETEGTQPLPEEGGELSARLALWEDALFLLLSESEKYAKEHGVKDFTLPEDDTVSYREFLAARENLSAADELVQNINALSSGKSGAIAEQARLARALSAAGPYREAGAFSSYTNTRHTVTKLGLVPSAAWGTCQQQLGELSLSAYEAVEGESVLLSVTAHRSALSQLEQILGGAGFVSCPYTGEQTGEELLASLNEELEGEKKKQEEAEKALFSLAPVVKELRLYCDVLGFELEKAEQAAKLRGTERTFLLEAFVPAAEEEKVKSALDGSGITVFYEFSDPAEDEFVPTLTKNNKVVENFEAITNMYSPPSAREFDPNTIMSFFYSIFLGFIMADVGYGLLMMLGGGFLYFNNRAKKGGIKSLAGVFAIGGIFAVIWGFLFNSVLGIAFLPFTVMPDAQHSNWKFVGIDIPSMLIISMLIGIAHIFAGYLCKFWQECRRGHFWDGLFDGITWAVFSMGMALAVVGLTEEFGLSQLTMAGGIVAVSALAVSVLTAGRHEKFLGKFTKGFGALYGIINYISDVLSYARLYGLMLSGAVIAQIISQYGVQFLTGGNVAFMMLGAVLMVVGHLFNLAMSLLGAYIHDARLQYVEFYGRFFEGEGELFAPLGSKRKYVRVI